MSARRNPATVAGLGVAASLVLPVTAQAVSLSAILEETFSNPVTTFGVGIAGGAAMAVLVGLAVSAARRQDDDPEPPDEKPSYAPRHLRPVEDRVESDEASGDSEEAPAKEKGSHAASGYEDIAQNYVGRASFRDRMARRAAGVAATLRERLDRNMMEGLPVIERADGSVGDVGTTWWRQAVGEVPIVEGNGFAKVGDRLAIRSDFTQTDRERLVTSGRNVGAIASRVAYVDEGAYPEMRTVEDLDNSDAWERALRSLDEKIAAVAPPQDPIGFIDSAGGADSLDEPDNLEPQTAFIHFKAPGGHPEVVDTNSYVDFLIEDEFSKNTSKAVRRTSRRFLRVLEGGSPRARHDDLDSTSTTYVGKHFSLPMAAEA